MLVGSKLLMFGGSLDLSNDITTLDLATRTWGRPAAVLGSPPGKRMSAVVALSRTDFLVFGGWIYASGEVRITLLWWKVWVVGAPVDASLPTVLSLGTHRQPWRCQWR